MTSVMWLKSTADTFIDVLLTNKPKRFQNPF